MAEAGRAFRGAAEISEFSPVIVNRPAREAVGPIRVIAFNARWGLQLEGIIECLRRPPLKGADLILLSEVDLNLRRSLNHDSAAEIARALEMSLAYVPEFAPRNHATHPAAFMGNALLSSHPIGEVRTIALPNLRRQRAVRMMAGGPQGVAAAIKFRGRQLTAGLAHLHSRTAPAGRESQMVRYLEGFPAAGPAIIGGDFNSTTIEIKGSLSMFAAMMKLALAPRRFRMPIRYEPLFARLAENNFRLEGANVIGQPTFTFSSVIPKWARPKLDWIALRELEAVEGSAVVVPAKIEKFGPRVSDHDFVMCEVKVQG
ncbi:MAG: endonuclease/exonuclease/phosphatase family protein [Candidatus Binataceae bacterium]